MKTIAYLRISTDQQDLASQKDEIKTYAEKRNMTIDHWIEIEISSRKNHHDRKIDELLSKLKRGDILIISELSRLSRSIKGTHQIMDKLAQKKIECHIIKNNLVTRGKNDMATKIYINAFSMAAEIERDLISQRTKAGLKAAKSRGVKLGNPEIYKMNINRDRKSIKFANKYKTTITGLVNERLTQRQIAAELENIGIKTIRGHDRWSVTSVRNVLNRLGLKTKLTK